MRANGMLYIAAADVAHGTAGIRWRSPQGEAERLGRVLDVYRGRYGSIWGEVAVDISGDSILFFGGRSEYLIIANSEWQPYDSMPIPRKARRGIPQDLDLAFGNGRNIYDVQSKLSVPFGLRALSGGRYAAFHLDARIVKNTTVVGQVFMTVLPSSKSARCIDVPVATHDPTAIPRLAFLADTLFVLDQVVRGDSAIVEVKKYLIGADVC